VQHALRAFSPNDQKNVRAAADTFRANPKLDTERVITELEVGEALVSVLDEKGAPTVVQRAYIYPPRSRLKPLALEERGTIIKGSVLYGHYENLVDRESAYEKLKANVEAKEKEAGEAPGKKQREEKSEAGMLLTSMAKSAAHAIGSQIGRQIIRGILGSLGGSRRG